MAHEICTKFILLSKAQVYLGQLRANFVVYAKSYYIKEIQIEILLFLNSQILLQIWSNLFPVLSNVAFFLSVPVDVIIIIRIASKIDIKVESSHFYCPVLNKLNCQLIAPCGVFLQIIHHHPKLIKMRLPMIYTMSTLNHKTSVYKYLSFRTMDIL